MSSIFSPSRPPSELPSSITIPSPQRSCSTLSIRSLLLSAAVQTFRDLYTSRQSCPCAEGAVLIQRSSSENGGRFSGIRRLALNYLETDNCCGQLHQKTCRTFQTSMKVQNVHDEGSKCLHRADISNLHEGSKCPPRLVVTRLVSVGLLERFFPIQENSAVDFLSESGFLSQEMGFSRNRPLARDGRGC